MSAGDSASPPLVALLQDWEQETRELLADLEFEPHPEGVLPSDEVARRTAALRTLRWTTMPRETLKQRHLWPAIRASLPDGRDVLAELKARKEAYEEELIRLRWADERSILFDRQVAKLVEQLRDDITFEERLLPRLATEIPGATSDHVAEQLARAGFLPVGPHPEAPTAPWLAAALSPFIALADRVRDRFTTAPG